MPAGKVLWQQCCRQCSWAGSLRAALPLGCLRHTLTVGRETKGGRQPPLQHSEGGLLFFILQKNGKGNAMASFQLLVWHTHSCSLASQPLLAFRVSALCAGSPRLGAHSRPPVSRTWV